MFECGEFDRVVMRVDDGVVRIFLCGGIFFGESCGECSGVLAGAHDWCG